MISSTAEEVGKISSREVGECHQLKADGLSPVTPHQLQYRREHLDTLGGRLVEPDLNLAVA
jgi:hypothetical protein